MNNYNVWCLTRAPVWFGLDNADHNFFLTKDFESDLVSSQTHPNSKIWQQL